MAGGVWSWSKMKVGSRPACKDQVAASRGWWEVWPGSRGLGRAGRRGPSPMQGERPAGRRTGCVGGRGGAPPSRVCRGTLCLSSSAPARWGASPASLGVWSHKAAGTWAPQTPGAEPPPDRDQPTSGAGPAAPGRARGWWIEVAEETVGGMHGGRPSPWLCWFGHSKPSWDLGSDPLPHGTES